MDIFSVLIAILLIVIVAFKRRYSYWKNLGVECLEPTIPFGNLKENVFQEKSIGQICLELYDTMKARKVKHAGCYFFHQAAYIPIHLELVKAIMQTDFNNFTDHVSYVNERDDPLSATVFAIGGQKWRNLRIKLTPIFTSGKMKLMFPIVKKLSQQLVETLQEECENQAMDAKDISARFTTDVIGNCAFGLECNSLKDPNTEFRVRAKRLFNLTRFETLKIFLGVVFPNVMKFFRTPLLPKDATDFFWNVIKETAEYRQSNGVRRDDAFQLLLDMLHSEGKGGGTKLTFGELAAQAFMFFTAGFDTSSTLMSFALLELSVNEDIQNHMRDEVNKVFQKNNGELTYEALSEMHYMDMVISETLRKYPPLPNLTRLCTKEYKVPDSNIVVREGESVMIPIIGIHYDPEFYSEPEKFDPTRFTEENKSRRPQFAFLPFGEGPRVCLGLRFGLMQAKIGLTSLIKNFRIKLNPQTEYPIKFDPKNLLTSAKGGLWLDVERINN